MKLSKLQKIALELIKGKTDILFLNDEKKIELIVNCHKFAKLFIEISEDAEMSWNGGTYE